MASRPAQWSGLRAALAGRALRREAADAGSSDPSRSDRPRTRRSSARATAGACSRSRTTALVLRDARTLKPAASRRGPLALARARSRSAPTTARSPSVGEDGSVRFIDLRKRHGAQRVGARIAARSPRLASRRTVARWSPRATTGTRSCGTSAPARRPRRCMDMRNGIAALQVSPDGRTLFTAGLDGAVFVWDLSGTQRLGRPIEAGGPNRTTLGAERRRPAAGGRPPRRDDQPSSTSPGRAGVGRSPSSPTAARWPASASCRVAGSPSSWDRTSSSRSSTPTPGARGAYAAAARRTIADYFTPGVSADGRLLAVPQSTGGNKIGVALWSLPSRRPIGAPLTRRSRDPRSPAEPRRRPLHRACSTTPG